MSSATYSPGSLVRARGREWIVLTGSTQDVIRVRPISGSEEDQTLIHLGLEAEPVREASFPPPRPEQKASHDAALILRDALLLSLRRGAGPFRSFGQIAVEPRAYQLVPLLMALKQDPVRLLVADDVGIGKTIESALIARELLDRGDIDRTAVLCPPHLVDQWITELDTRFHIRAVPVTAGTARRLERNIPMGESVFSAHPHTVVSLDYIKSEARRADFLRACPSFVIVDEAHTCAASGKGKHQRYELLKGLSENPQRHMVLLTATPHSGDEAAFYRLLGLLDPEFEKLVDTSADSHAALRERLSRHFVQRRRPDIDAWQEGSEFARRESRELTYRLTGEWDEFFHAVLDYCASVVQAAGADERRQRLNFWGTLALMRCVASSPAAASKALRTRAGLDSPDEEEALEDRVFDGSVDGMPEDDVEPAVGAEDPALAALIRSAEKLTGHEGDPKLKLVMDHVSELLNDGFSPVVFCRYIATAHYLAEHLTARLPEVTVEVVTGDDPSDARRAKVDAMGEAEARVLVATDCLSEGINLQEHFDAVVHYDLSWNPTRHEQREGRVDRFGQSSKVVRTTLIYGANNPVDGAVLEVILRKAKKIREELGVPVPIPDDGHTLTQALLKAVLLQRRKENLQTELPLLYKDEAQAINTAWEDAADKAKKNRTVFAQRRLKPEEVLPEWHKSLGAIGSQEDVHRFVARSLSRLGSGLEPLNPSRPDAGFKAPLVTLPEEVRERLEAEGLDGTLLVDFKYPASPRCHAVQRSHPLVSVLAETLLERTLGTSGATQAEDLGSSEAGTLGRVGVWVSAAVSVRTTIALLRLRHQLVTIRSGEPSILLVEEAGALSWAGANSIDLTEGEEALKLLSAPPAGDPPAPVRARVVVEALSQLDARRAELKAFAKRRAEALLADHRRVREAARALGRYEVRALLPPDVIGVFILLPKVS